MYKKFISNIFIIIFLNSALQRVESKNNKKIDPQTDANKGLRLKRINVKQSLEIDKVYETDDPETSADYAKEQIGKVKLWQYNPLDGDTIQNLHNPTRKFLDWKTTPVVQTKEKAKFTPRVNPKVRTEFNTEGKVNNTREISQKEKLKESKKTFKGMNNGGNYEIKIEKPKDNLKRMKSDNSYNNFSLPVVNKAMKSGRYSTKSANIKSVENFKTQREKTRNVGRKTMQNISDSDILISKREDLTTDWNQKTKPFKTVTEKIHNYDNKFNLININVQNQHKFTSLATTSRLKVKTNNIKEDKKVDGNLVTPLKTIQKNTTLKLRTLEKPHNEQYETNIADFMNSFKRFPLKLQKRVMVEVFSRHPEFRKTPEENITTSLNLVHITPQDLPKSSNSISVEFAYSSSTISANLPQSTLTIPTKLPHSSSNISVEPSQPSKLISVNSPRALLPHSSSTISVEPPQPSKMISVNSLPALSTYSFGHNDLSNNESLEYSEPYSLTTELPKLNSIESENLHETSDNITDFTETYSTTPVDLSEVYITTSVYPTDEDVEISTFEKRSALSDKDLHSSEASAKAKFHSKMLQEFSEMYSIPPPINGSTRSPSLPEKKFPQRSSNKKKKLPQFHPIHKNGNGMVKLKKNKRNSRKNNKEIAGTLNNYFTFLPQNKKRSQEDIHTKVNRFFDKMNKPSKMKHSKKLRSHFTPFVITVKPREIDPTIDLDRIKIKEFYYNDYEASSENNVMDTLGDLSEEFAA